jgi:hypothetical protein
MALDPIAITSGAISVLLTIVMVLAQSHWRATIMRLDERFTYERAKLDHIIEEHNHQALQLATYAATNNAIASRLMSIEEDLNVFRKELINISQSLIRIETQIRKSTPPPRGG